MREEAGRVEGRWGRADERDRKREDRRLPGLNWNCHVRASEAHQRKNNLYRIEFNCEPPPSLPSRPLALLHRARHSPPSSSQTPWLAFANGTGATVDENKGECGEAA